MIVLSIWALILALFALSVYLGRRLGLLPIISQLLMAGLGLPLLVLFGIEPYWPPGVTALTSPLWVQALYSLAFALLLQQIIGEAIDLDFDRRSLLIALPSFALPFVAGVACAVWLLPDMSGLGRFSLGLVFAITAIPVLYLYLKHIGYPPQASRLLLQAAMLIDLTCWSLFGVASGVGRLDAMLLPLIAAFTPWLLYALGARRPLIYSLALFGLLVLAEHFSLNALLLGIGFVLNLAWLKIPAVAALPARWLRPLQSYLAIPLLLACGILKIDLHGALTELRPEQWLGLLLAPIAAKILGSWIGMTWSGLDGAALGQGRFPRLSAAILLNIRGLSEIVFLNLLLEQRIISPAIYLALMLMSLVATLMPALAGLQRIPSTRYPEARRPSAEH